jgi:putative ATP-grasp target RiPP
MNKKNSMSSMVNPVNRITIQDLPAELVELSEENLHQVVGGKEPEWTLSASISYKDGWGGSIGVSVKFW